MKKSIAISVLAAVMGSGCTSLVKCQDTEVNGTKVGYCLGKVSGDGQEGVFRDIFVDGKPIVSHFGSGSSLWGQALQGAVGSALIAGGAVGAAAMLRPDRTYNQVGSANVQDQTQEQGQGYEGTVSPTIQATGGTSSASAKGGTANADSSSSSVSGSTSSSSSTSSSASNSTSKNPRNKKPTPPPVKKPHDDNGHGNDEGHKDPSNPGKKY